MRVLLVAAMILAGPTVAAAQALTLPPAQASQAEFAALDRNRDAVISRFEAMADVDVSRRFAAFDEDRDGALSEAEFARVREEIARRQLADMAITARVKAVLLLEKGVPSTAISVETYDGRVLLSGFVDSPEMASRAGRLTATVSGVRTVHNGISVK